MTTIDIKSYAEAKVGTPTMDHAFEFDWLQKFFDWLTGSRAGGPSMSCSSFDSIFFDNGNANRLEDVFNSLASSLNIEDFVGMNDQFNQLYKGSVANQQTLKNICAAVSGKTKKANPRMPSKQFDKVGNDVKQQLDVLETVYWGVQTINYGPVMDKITTTYSRILNALSKLDSDAQCSSGTNPGISDYFETYVQALMFGANYGISDSSSKCAQNLLQYASDNLNIMQTWINGDATRQSTIDGLGERYDFYNKLGNPADSSDTTWRIAFNAPVLSKEKRQDGAACSLPSSQTGTATSDIISATITSGGSTFITATRTGNSSTSAFTPYCSNWANPQEDIDYCTCTDGLRFEPATSGNVCPIASPGPSSLLISSSTSSTVTSAWTTTTTDIGGDVIACTSWSTLDIGVAASVCVGSTISTFTPSPTTTETPTPTPTAKFEMAFDLMEYEGLTGTQWYAYANGYDDSTNVCEDSIDVLDAPEDVDPTRGDAVPFPDFPGGIDIRQKEVMGYKNCKYVGTSDAPGRLQCDGLDAGCEEQIYTGDQLYCQAIDGSIDNIYPKVICAF
ncbi:hypothetical protein K431DRAFT_283262 [Polychaeton citri CBS 116435]|uniref:Uncharacterized protein n=1 Tax=Polychaeton citri CBS 116435 TaxID=1314669 RepID=A0A9P4QDS6_9PEZI|nr:hypothetical protein K431DRAFT_283262 [Polychaeton citri CBS 116435]